MDGRPSSACSIAAALAGKIIDCYSRAGDLISDPDLNPDHLELLHAATASGRDAVGLTRGRRQAVHARAAHERAQLQDLPARAGALRILGAHDTTDVTGRVSLVVTGLHPHPEGGPAEQNLDEVFVVARRLLCPGGLLVHVSHPHPDPETFSDQPGLATRAAGRVGLTYLQHVIAITVPSHTLTAPHAGGSAAMVVHADVTAYRNPTGAE